MHNCLIQTEVVFGFFHSFGPLMWDVDPIVGHHIPFHFCFVCFIRLLYLILKFNSHTSYCICTQLLFINMSCLLESTKIAKKKKVRHEPDLLSYFVFWYELVNVRVYVLASMLRFKLLDF